MSRFKRKLGNARTAAALTVAFACLGPVACGGSTGTSTGTPAASTTDPTPTSSTPSAGHASSLVQTIVRCLRSNGINLPEPDAKGNVDTTGINMNSRQYRAAVAKCERTFAEKHHP